jgi:hypothetical protein
MVSAAPERTARLSARREPLEVCICELCRDRLAAIFSDAAGRTIRICSRCFTLIKIATNPIVKPNE